MTSCSVKCTGQNIAPSTLQKNPASDKLGLISAKVIRRVRNELIYQEALIILFTIHHVPAGVVTVYRS